MKYCMIPRCKCKWQIPPYTIFTIITGRTIRPHMSNSRCNGLLSRTQQVFTWNLFELQQFAPLTYCEAWSVTSVLLVIHRKLLFSFTCDFVYNMPSVKQTAFKYCALLYLCCVEMKVSPSWPTFSSLYTNIFIACLYFSQAFFRLCWFAFRVIVYTVYTCGRSIILYFNQPRWLSW